MIVAGIIAYFIGSFPSALIASKFVGGPDVRYHGSGNVGGTNTAGLLGPRIGAAVVVADALKGLFAWAIVYIIMGGSPWALPVAGTMAVIGHCWPIYTRFHGGLGLATGGGLLFVVFPWVIFIAIPFWLIFFFGVFKKRYSPRAVILALPLATIVSLLGIPMASNKQWLLIAMISVLVIRHLPQWNRVE